MVWVFTITVYSTLLYYCIYSASMQELADTHTHTSKNVSSLDALILPRCFNNVCNIEDKVVNKEYQIKAKCLHQREFVQDTMVMMKLVWNRRKKQKPFTLHFNSKSSADSADRRICSVSVFFVRLPCKEPLGVNPVVFLQVKYHSVYQMPWPKLNPLSMKHGVGCGAWQLCVVAETHRLT